MKLSKRAIKEILRQKIKIYKYQFIFMPRRSTMEAIFSLSPCLASLCFDFILQNL